MRSKEIGTDLQPGLQEHSIFARAQSRAREVWAFAYRPPALLSTTSGPVVVAAVFCLVFLVMGAAFSFSTFAIELGHDLNAGSGSISFIFGCAMALLYGGGLFSGVLADRIGTHRVAGAGALLAGVSLAAAGTVGRVWQADVALGLGFGLGLAVCYTPAVAAVQPWFDRNRGVASGIALSGTGLGTLLMPLLARWLIDDEGWRAALIIMGLGVACFGFVASNWIRLPPGLPMTSSSPWSHSSLRKLSREPSFRRLYVAGFLSSLVLLVPIVHMVPHAIRAGVAPRDAAWLISILGLWFSRGPTDAWPCCRSAWTPADFGRASRGAGDIVSRLDNQGRVCRPSLFCVRLWCLLRRDHCAAAGSHRRPFRRPEFGCSDRPALHEFRARAACRSRGVRLLGRLLE